MAVLMSHLISISILFITCQQFPVTIRKCNVWSPAVSVWTDGKIVCCIYCVKMQNGLKLEGYKFVGISWISENRRIVWIFIFNKFLEKDRAVLMSHLISISILFITCQQFPVTIRKCINVCMKSLPTGSLKWI
jgi:hypothetical protein